MISSNEISSNEASDCIAQIILNGFNRHFDIFKSFNQRARTCFIEEQWQQAKEDAKEQVDLYDRRVEETLTALRAENIETELDASLWQAVKLAYIQTLLTHKQPELAESYFNSVFCRLFKRNYFNNQYIFLHHTIATRNLQDSEIDYRSYYPLEHGFEAAILQLLQDSRVGLDFKTIEIDVDNICQRILQHFPDPNTLSRHFQIHVLSPLFYRNKAAYIVGRIIHDQHVYPLIIPLLHDENGVKADAALIDYIDIVNIFSFTRAYFKVDFDVPSAIVRFLESILPTKTSAELYTTLGYHKQGKGEFYRLFLYHLRHSSDQFVVAPGVEGMVMHVFTLPSYPYVFKIIKDRFHPNKKVTRQNVKDCYHLVKQLDRVGRMADTWEFSQVAFPLARFSKASLQALTEYCADNMSIEADQLIIHHVYIERRMIPLNLYINTCGDDERSRILDDYGQAIRDIAAAGIFPGDLLLKNFGVTSHGRVVFYDYDEIQPLQKCVFRDIPKAQTYEQEMASEPWYYVGHHDIFPEEFAQFLFTNPEERWLFQTHHQDLLTAKGWQTIQASVIQGDILDIFPYRQSQRFISHKA